MSGTIDENRRGTEVDTPNMRSRESPRRALRGTK